MSITVVCSCGRQLRVPDEQAGMVGRCPICKAEIKIPDKEIPFLELAPIPQKAIIPKIKEIPIKTRPRKKFKRINRKRTSNTLVVLLISIIVFIVTLKIVSNTGNANSAWNPSGSATIKQSLYDMPVSREAKTHFDRAWARDENGNLKGAIDSFTEAILIQPKFVKAYIGRAWSHSRIETSSPEESRERVLRDLDEAIKLCQNFEVFQNSASLRYNLGDFKVAIEHYTKAIQFKPNHAKAYYGRGYTYYYMDGNFTRYDRKFPSRLAESDFINFLDLSKNDPKMEAERQDVKEILNMARK